MSALPSKADINYRERDVRFVHIPELSIIENIAGRSGIAALHESCIRKRRPSTEKRIAAS
jgi:hypothetical protein